MKIIYLNNYHYIRGGAESVFFSEMGLMKDKGHEVVGFARRHEQDLPSPYSDYFPPEMKTDEVRISWSSFKTVKKIFYSAETRRKLHMLVRRTRPEIAHAHNIYGRLSTYVLDCLNEEGIPVVLTLHDYKLVCPTYNFICNHHICKDCKVHRYYRAVLKRCHKESYAASAVYALESYYNWLFRKYEGRVGRYVAPSRFLKSKLIEYGWPEERISYVPNFIDHAEYQAEYDPGTYFLYLGRLSEEKGIRVLIEAFKRIEKPGASLVIAGEGKIGDTLEKISQPDSRITFTGYLTDSDLRNLTRRALAVVLPSVWYENAPLAILEAMAYGKPVIGSAVGGIPEMIDDEMNGFLFEPGNVTDLQEKLAFFLNLPEQRVLEMGKAARKKVEKEYNAESHYKQLMNVYRKALGMT